MSASSTEAQWRRVPISPYGNYEVSSTGLVRRDGRILAGDIDRYGYHRVSLSYAGLARRFKVHRLVCEAFHGPGPDGQEVCHNDGDPLNNRANNLRWATRSENVRDSIAHGTFASDPAKATAVSRLLDRRGHRNPNSKLTPEQVASVWEDRAGGASERAIASKHGCAPSTIHKLLKRSL